MNREQIMTAIQMARELNEDLQLVARAYEYPQETLDEIENPEEAGQLFVELLDTLQILSRDLNELFPRRLVILDDQKLEIRSPLPRYLEQYKFEGNKPIIISGIDVSPSVKELIRKMGIIPPWKKIPPTP